MIDDFATTSYTARAVYYFLDPEMMALVLTLEVNDVVSKRQYSNLSIVK